MTSLKVGQAVVVRRSLAAIMPVAALTAMQASPCILIRVYEHLAVVRSLATNAIYSVPVAAIKAVNLIDEPYRLRVPLLSRPIDVKFVSPAHFQPEHIVAMFENAALYGTPLPPDFPYAAMVPRLLVSPKLANLYDIETDTSDILADLYCRKAGLFARVRIFRIDADMFSVNVRKVVANKQQVEKDLKEFA